jgi:ribosome-binding protein aMBF1 (putative translation factor)
MAVEVDRIHLPFPLQFHDNKKSIRMKSKTVKKRRRLMNEKHHAQLLVTFGQHLASCRQALKLSQLQLAKRSGIELGNLGKYERGKREPGLAIIMIFAKGLEIDPRALLDFPFEFENRV